MRCHDKRDDISTCNVVRGDDPGAHGGREPEARLYAGDDDSQQTVVHHTAEVVPHKHPEEPPGGRVEPLQCTICLTEWSGSYSG